MSTKYQRPSGAFEGDVSLANRQKYQNDAAALPPVAISSSKIDGDLNYLVAAVNEIDNAAGTRASIADRLNVALNDDGTLKSSAGLALDNWIVQSVSNLARVSDVSVSVDGDQTSIYTAFRRVRLTVASVQLFANVESSSFAGGVTTIVFDSIVDSTNVASTISVTPTVIAYGPLTTGAGGNAPLTSAQYKLRDDAPLLRVKDTGASGKEFALRSDGGVLEFLENTGSESSPTWVNRGSVSSAGIAGATVSDGSITTAKLANDAVTLAKLASGTANKFIGFDGSGNPTELDVVVADGSITSAKLAADAVTSDKIADDAVGASEIAANAVTTSKVIDDAITLDKLAHGTANKLVGFNGSGVPAEIDVPVGGKILQVVSVSKTDTFTMTSTTFADVTGLAATITPSSTSSKILVVVDMNWSTNGGNNQAMAKLLRDSTDISVGATASARTLSSLYIGTATPNSTNNGAIHFLDSPATTSAVTYKMQVKTNVGGNAASVNRSASDTDVVDRARTASNITLMEIGA